MCVLCDVLGTDNWNLVCIAPTEQKRLIVPKVLWERSRERERDVTHLGGIGEKSVKEVAMKRGWERCVRSEPHREERAEAFSVA